MNRRHFFKSSVGAAVALSFHQSLIRAALGDGGTTVKHDVHAVTGDGRQVTLPQAAVQELADSLRANLILPVGEGYDQARLVLNPEINQFPALVVQPEGAADVQLAVQFARQENLLTAVKCGGHAFSGISTCNGGMQIDLSLMRHVRVDPVKQTAWVAGGSLLGEMDFEAMANGLVTTAGSVSHTGVGGLTLGGGFGRLARKYGLSCDNVLSVDIVTADGRLRRASAEENPDLYWAVRGGGGNFGVVTSFEYRLHELETITAGLALYPPEMIRDMFRFYRDYTSTAPDTVTAMAGIAQAPPGSPLEGGQVGFLQACHSGAASEGARLLQPIKAFGPPAIDLIGVMPYTTLQTLSDANFPVGNRNYWRSNFLTELSDQAIDIILERAGGMPRNAHSALFFEHMGGAVGRVGPEDTAFSNRDATFNFTVLAGWTDPAEDETHANWTRSFGDAMKTLATGAGYVNYMMDDEGSARVRATYERNFDRLVAVKRKYDPTNFFSGNQNIAP